MDGRDALHHGRPPSNASSSASSSFVDDSNSPFPLDDEQDFGFDGPADYLLPAIAYTAPRQSLPSVSVTPRRPSVVTANSSSVILGRAPPASFAAFRSKNPAKPLPLPPPPFLRTQQQDQQTPFLRRAGSLDTGLRSPALQEAFSVDSDVAQARPHLPVRSASISGAHSRQKARISAAYEEDNPTPPELSYSYHHHHQHHHQPYPLSPFLEEDAQFDEGPFSSPSEYDEPNDNDLLRPGLGRSNDSYHTARNSLSGGDGNEEADRLTRPRTRTMSSAGRPTNLTVQVDSQQAQNSASPKSPSAKVSSFFGWKAAAKPDSPTTSFADSRDASRSPSPMSGAFRNRNFADTDESYASGNVSPAAYGGHDGASYIDELLRELREVGVELASSIKREMDLEDEIDRYRADMPNGPSDHTNRRTSDYYSDSGASSIRLPGADPETKMEALEKMRRKAEQEKAQLRIDSAQNLQDNLNQRRALEMHVQSLEEQIKMQEFHASEPTEKEQELTESLKDMKRRLSQERDHKQNLEDLFNVMKAEADAHRSERDNLRDEVVPKLRAQLDGLESQSAEKETLTYENARLQQEIDSLKNENQTLASARKLQLDTQHNLEGGMARSGSLRNKNSKHKPSTSRDYLPTEALPDRLEKVEEQRDALQRTLQALILRHNHMMKQQSKSIRDLAAERDKALRATPRRAAFQLEVQHLRKEIDLLRRRADDAFEAKFQCEKGLSGLRMDLERAQQETSSLRDLLSQREVFIPLEHVSSSSSSTSSDTDDLNKSYNALMEMHAKALDELKKSRSDESVLKEAELRMTELSMQVRSQINSNEELRNRLTAAIERGETEQESSTKRIVDLESVLRAAEEKVIAAQSASEEALTQHEEHIKEMDDAEGEQMQRRISSPMKIFTPVASSSTKKHSSTFLSPESAKHPSPFGPRSPRLDMTTSGKGQSVSEASKVAALEEKVRELETAAGKADVEMQEVVSRMNMAQMEVAELQTERDEAIRQTRRLQISIKEEKERVKAIAA